MSDSELGHETVSQDVEAGDDHFPRRVIAYQQAGFIIVTIGLPDPKYVVLKPHVGTLSLILIFAGPTHGVLPQRI
jgi:hypothetical protein